MSWKHTIKDTIYLILQFNKENCKVIIAEVTFTQDCTAAIGQQFVPFLISYINNSIQYTKCLLYEGLSSSRRSACRSSGLLHITYKVTQYLLSLHNKPSISLMNCM